MRLARTPIALSAVVAFLFATGAPARAEPVDDGNRAWSVRPATADGKPDKRTHYTLQGAAGGNVAQHVLVTNASKVRASFVIYGTDAFNTSTRAVDLLPPAAKATDIRSLVQVSA